MTYVLTGIWWPVELETSTLGDSVDLRGQSPVDGRKQENVRRIPGAAALQILGCRSDVPSSKADIEHAVTVDTL